MKFVEKKRHYMSMQDPKYLEADRALLEKLNPGSQALSTGVIDKARAQRETLWALLDVATADQIKANRPAEKKVLSNLDIFFIKEVVESKFPLIKEVLDLEAKAEIIKEIKELIVDLPEEISISIITKAESIIPDFIKEREAFEAKIAAEKELIELDIDKADQKKLASITRFLKLQAENFKAITLKPLLIKYRESITKPVLPADFNKVNELEEENEDLRTELEDKETENEDLQDQVDDLTDQLEEEKKSEADQ